MQACISLFESCAFRWGHDNVEEAMRGTEVRHMG